MNVYENIKAGFASLLQIGEQTKEYIEDAAGITRDRLDALIRGAEPSPMELLSICSVLDHLNISDSAKAVAEQWLNERTAFTADKQNYLRGLKEVSGCGTVEQLLQKYHIFMDGSILCAEQIGAFLDRLLPDLERIEGSHPVSIPVSVVRSIEEMAQIPMLHMDSVAKNIARIQKADQLVVRGDDQDKTTLSTFISAFSKFKPDHALVLLTHDEVLAKAVNMLNAIGIEGEDVVVLKLRRDGTAVRWDEPDEPVEVNEVDETSLTEGTFVVELPREDAPVPVETDWVGLHDEDPAPSPAAQVPEEVIIFEEGDDSEVVILDEDFGDEMIIDLGEEGTLEASVPDDTTMCVADIDLESLLKETEHTLEPGLDEDAEFGRMLETAGFPGEISEAPEAEEIIVEESEDDDDEEIIVDESVDDNMEEIIVDESEGDIDEEIIVDESVDDIDGEIIADEFEDGIDGEIIVDESEDDIDQEIIADESEENDPVIAELAQQMQFGDQDDALPIDEDSLKQFMDVSSMLDLDDGEEDASLSDDEDDDMSDEDDDDLSDEDDEDDDEDRDEDMLERLIREALEKGKDQLDDARQELFSGDDHLIIID